MPSKTVCLSVRATTIVFAGARDPSDQALKDLSAKYPNVHPRKVQLWKQGR